MGVPKDPNERVGVSKASNSVVPIKVCGSVEVNECRGKRMVTCKVSGATTAASGSVVALGGVAETPPAALGASLRAAPACAHAAQGVGERAIGHGQVLGTTKRGRG